MSFECIDPIGCNCHCHVSWETHVPVCPFCSAPLRDAVGKPLVEGTEQAHCPWCRRNSVLPRRHSIGVLPPWLWRDRANHPEAYMPAGEVAEMAATAEPPEQPLDEVQR